MGSIYIRPDDTVAMEAFTQQMATLYHQHSDILLTGDFNAKHALWYNGKQNALGEQLVNFLLTTDMVILNNNSRTYKNSVIDLTLAKECHRLIKRWEVDESIFVQTDHHMIRFKMDMEVVRNAVDKWNINKADWETYDEHLLNRINELIQNSDQMNPDELYSCLKSCVIKTAEESIPKIKANGKHKSWWDEDMSEKYNEVKKKRNRYKKRSDGSRLEQLLAAKKEFQKMFSEKLANHMCRVVENGQQTELWKVVRNYNNNRLRPAIQPILDETSGIMKHTDQDIASIFIKHYGDKPIHIEDAVKQEIEVEAAKILRETSNIENQVLNEPFNSTEAERALYKIRDQVGYSAYENIHAMMIKRNNTGIVEIVKILANKCLLHGKFPEETKKDQKLLTQKPTAEDLNITNAYRPITLESLISKCIVTMVRSRLEWMLESCGMISYSQDAYRSEHDGNDLLVRLIQFVQESWNRGETVVVFISDFQGFFESVWRPLLVIKLQRAGVTGNMP